MSETLALAAQSKTFVRQNHAENTLVACLIGVWAANTRRGQFAPERNEMKLHLRDHEVASAIGLLFCVCMLRYSASSHKQKSAKGCLVQLQLRWLCPNGM